MRSSATAEGTETGLAGMNETFPNVRGAGAVVEAPRPFRDLLFSPHVNYYRAVNGFAMPR